MTRLAVLIMVGLIVLMPLMSGCGIGYTRTIFATKTNVGLEVSTKPPTLELDISRFEGVVSPQFENGKKLPVMASFRFGNKASFSPAVGSAFATGDAATTMTALYSEDTPSGTWIDRAKLVAGSKELFPANSTLVLKEKPIVMRWLPAWLDWLRPEFQETDVRPVFFGTDTALGIKVAWSGMTGGFPDSAMFGYNRKELALVPISIQEVVPVTGPPTYHMKQASLLATLDSKSELSTGKEDEKGVDFQLVQYFATGDAATLMALQADVRKAMLMRLDPNGQEFKKKFGEFLTGEGDVNRQAGIVIAEIYDGLVKLAEESGEGAQAKYHVANLDKLGKIVPTEVFQYAKDRPKPNELEVIIKTKLDPAKLRPKGKENYKTFLQYKSALDISIKALSRNLNSNNEFKFKDGREAEAKKATDTQKNDLRKVLSEYVALKSQLAQKISENKSAINAIKYGASGFSMGQDPAPHNESRWPS